MKLRDYIADKSFYRKLIVLLVPLVLQQSLSSIVNLLDNIMVGQLSTESLSGVAIVNQLVYVFNFTLFGAISGASIFGAQYHGRGSVEGVRYTFRFRLLVGVGMAAAALVLFALKGGALIRLYLNRDASDAGNLDIAFSQAHIYLKTSLWGLIPFAVSCALSSTLRDTGETFRPMISGVLAILINAILNFLLIFGYLGFSPMGVKGAAIATVISRYVEMTYLLVYSARSRQRHPFLAGAFRSMYVPWNVVKRILVTGAPLLLNELLWSMGMAMISQCYSVRGLDAVASTNICATVQQLFTIILIAMGSAIAILVGQQLGAGDKEGARLTAGRLLVLSVAMHVVIGIIMICAAPLVPRLYNVEPHVRTITEQMLVILGAILPVEAAVHASYFILRSGGKTMIIFLFDSGFTWAVCLALAWCLSRYTDLSILWIYGIVQATSILKTIVGLLLVRSGVWLNTMVKDL